MPIYSKQQCKSVQVESCFADVVVGASLFVTITEIRLFNVDVDINLI